MRRWIWIILLVLLSVQTAEATQLPQELQKALPAEAEELLDELQGSDSEDTLSGGLAALWNKGCSYFIGALKERIGSVVILLVIVLVCALADDCFHAVESSRTADFAPLAGAAAITVAATGSIQSLMGMGLATIEELHIFSKALLPTLAAAMAAGGGVVSAGLRHVAGVLFSDLLITMIRDLLIPLVYFYIIASAADAMLAGSRLKGIAKGIGKTIAWLLTGSLLLYTGYLSLSGTMAASADSLATQVTRSAMGVVPVVGGIISDAAGTVLAGAAMLKNTIGIAGMLAVLAVCLVPFLELAAQYLLYKVASYLAGTIGSPRLVGMIDALGSALGMVLGMTGACALMLLISVITSVTVVTV